MLTIKTILKHLSRVLLEKGYPFIKKNLANLKNVNVLFLAKNLIKFNKKNFLQNLFISSLTKYLKNLGILIQKEKRRWLRWLLRAIKIKRENYNKIYFFL